MNTTITAAIVALIIGFGGGYYVAVSASPVSNSHVMPDGSMMSNSMADMTAGLQDKAGDAFDQAFIEEMIVHHEGAVAMAEQALQKAKHAEIKQMATEIIAAQTREIETMRTWLKDWYGISE